MRSTTINEVLEAMWNSIEEKTSNAIHERATKARWRKILAQHHLDQTRLVLHVGNGHFLVNSDSRPGEFHSVDLETGDCSCESATLSHNTNCKHLRAIKDLDKRGLLPKNTKWKGKVCGVNGE